MAYQDNPIDSLDRPAAATRSDFVTIGTKATHGLSAMGEPVFAEQSVAIFVSTMRQFFPICNNVRYSSCWLRLQKGRREDVAASIQKALETRLAVGKPAARTSSSRHPA
jgi:hypothetical protein